MGTGTVDSGMRTVTVAVCVCVLIITVSTSVSQKGDGCCSKTLIMHQQMW